MANKFTRFLKSFAQGVLNPKGQLGDFRHASRLYVDNFYALSPRTKFMYHVSFDINSQALKSQAFKKEHRKELGMLVKSADLPKFTITTQTKNQYNRKKTVQTQIEYSPLNIVFHDDNAGVTNALWALYYGYYYVDRSKPKEKYEKSPYKKDVYKGGLDNNQSEPFFNSITIYTLSRKRFLSYTLVNPLITEWSHSPVSQSESNGIMENSMTVAYEGVIYNGGSVSVGNPDNFAELHYDTLPSPLSIAGGGTRSLTGTGGVLAGINQVFGALGSGTAFSSPGNFLGTAIAAVNTYNNARSLTGAGLRQEGLNILTSPAGIGAIAGAIGGVAGAIWPKGTNQSGTTNAKPKDFGGTI